MTLISRLTEIDLLRNTETQNCYPVPSYLSLPFPGSDAMEDLLVSDDLIAVIEASPENIVEVPFYSRKDPFFSESELDPDWEESSWFLDLKQEEANEDRILDSWDLLNDCIQTNIIAFFRVLLEWIESACESSIPGDVYLRNINIAFQYYSKAQGQNDLEGRVREQEWHRDQRMFFLATFGEPECRTLHVSVPFNFELAPGEVYNDKLRQTIEFDVPEEHIQSLPKETLAFLSQLSPHCQARVKSPGMRILVTAEIGFPESE